MDRVFHFKGFPWNPSLYVAFKHVKYMKKVTNWLWPYLFWNRNRSNNAYLVNGIDVLHHRASLVASYKLHGISFQIYQLPIILISVSLNPTVHPCAWLCSPLLGNHSGFDCQLTQRGYHFHEIWKSAFRTIFSWRGEFLGIKNFCINRFWREYYWWDLKKWSQFLIWKDFPKKKLFLHILITPVVFCRHTKTKNWWIH